MLPYRLDTVILNSTSLSINDRTWSFYVFMNDEEDVLPDECSVSFESPGYRFQHRIMMSAKLGLEKLVKEYLRKGTCTSVLKVWTIPDGIPPNLTMIVQDFVLEYANREVYHSILPYVENRLQLNKIRFLVNNETCQLLDDPAVKNAVFLDLQFPYHNPVDTNDLLLRLCTREIYMIHIAFPIEKVYALAKHWISSQRPIGTKFTLTIEEYLYVLDVMEYVQARENQAIPSKVIALGSHYFAHCVTIPISETSELVMFGGKMREVWKPLEWTFRMEVMASGATVPNK
uniref:Uncharacterized protein n=1 Tax=Caenorhabditis japonica TaxID=281687 RepID=A0A8R1E9X6_CAEJA